MLVQENPVLSIRRQCKLLNVSRSGLFYQPVGESELNLTLMKLIDKLHTSYPFMGQRMIKDQLVLAGYAVNVKRVARLMKLMQIISMAPGPHTSRPGQQSIYYPYLLRYLQIDLPNLVWAADITYIPVRKGFFYLFVIMDWYSRFILTWRLSNSMEAEFCIEPLQILLKNCKPYIFNTDQGSQFSSNGWIETLLRTDVKVSMDGKGRYLDNIFVERFWRTLKYEEIYLNHYYDFKELEKNLKTYFDFYNYHRPHSSLNKKTPGEIYEI